MKIQIMDRAKKNRRIWVFGGTGVGKTTFSRKLSEKIGILHYATDDFVYKKKWSEKNSEEERMRALKTVTKKRSWIIEGVHSLGWVIPGIKKADIIILLRAPLPIIFSRIIKRERRGKTKEDRTSIFSILKLFWWAIISTKGWYTRYKREGVQFFTLSGSKKMNKFIKEFKR